MNERKGKNAKIICRIAIIAATFVFLPMASTVNSGVQCREPVNGANVKFLRYSWVPHPWFVRVGFLPYCNFLRMANAGAQGKELRVAAAADLKFAMQDLAGQFEKQTGEKIAVTYGSSGNFFAQLQNGAPFDIFFSADIDYPKKLEAAGLTVPGSLSSYAVGRIVIWMPPDSPVDFAKLGWNALLDPRVQKVAIANPAHAPYGRAAIAALQKAGIYEQVKNKLVLGENISQAAQFVQSGNAQAGIVAFSLAVSPAMKNGKRWEIPAAMYPALEQGAVILKSAENKEAAKAFLKFMKTDAGRTTLAKYGFTIPIAPPPEP